MTTPDATRCALCGADNDCAAAAGRDSRWCVAVRIDRTVLARVAAELERQVCVCARWAGAEPEPTAIGKRSRG